MTRHRKILVAALACIAALGLFFGFGFHKTVLQTTRAIMRTVTGDVPEVPVIESGREQEIMALFKQHPLGGYPTTGWRFMQLTVLARSIFVRIDGPAGRTASMTLRHPDDVRGGAQHTTNFVVVRGEADPEGNAALDVLIDDLTHNDQGKFWRVRAGLLFDTQDGQAGPVMRSLSWVQDGVVVVGLIFCVLLMVLWRSLRGEPRSTLGWLLVVATVGASIRFLVSVPTTMDVWPYSRLLAVPRMLFESRILGGLSARFGWRIHLNELILTYDMAASLLAPFAVFVHAKALLRDTRAALWASAIIATLPAHIRFSHSDSGFIPSAVYASVTFALISQSLRDSSRGWRIAALVCAPWMMIITMEQRALNTMFPLLYIGQIWLLQPLEIPRSRRVTATVVVLLTTVLFVLGGFIEKNSGTIQEGLSTKTLWNALGGLFRPRFNTLINFRITPPLDLVLVITGLVFLWRSEKRRLCIFLIVWPGLFYLANSLIVPSTSEMQSRYHLHFAAPFALAAGWGIRAGMEALTAYEKTRAWAGMRAQLVLCAYLLLVPIMHVGYERRSDFNDIHEYEFVRRWRDKIPAGCTVMEHFTPGNPHEMRFFRMGRMLDHGQIMQAVRTVHVTAAVPAQGGDPLLPEARALLSDPPDCLYFFRGMPCFGIKKPEESIAPACDAIMHDVPTDVIAQEVFPNAPYDEAVSVGIMHQNISVEIGLYRVRVEEIRAHAGKH